MSRAHRATRHVSFEKPVGFQNPAKACEHHAHHRRGSPPLRDHLYESGARRVVTLGQEAADAFAAIFPLCGSAQTRWSGAPLQRLPSMRLTSVAIVRFSFARGVDGVDGYWQAADDLDKWRTRGCDPGAQAPAPGGSSARTMP